MDIPIFVYSLAIHYIHYSTPCFSVGQTCFLFAMFRCSPGYTGNPQTLGGSCQECECDQYGSLPVPCDPVTGQCTCKPGFTGWKCDGCEHRHARDGMKCICTYTNVILENFCLFVIFLLLQRSVVVWLPLKILVEFLPTLAFWSIFFTSLEMFGKLTVLFFTCLLKTDNKTLKDYEGLFYFILFFWGGREEGRSVEVYSLPKYWHCCCYRLNILY